MDVVFRNGLMYLDEKERNNSIDERFQVEGHVRRGSRSKESEIGSDNWLQDCKSDMSFALSVVY